MTPAEAVSDTRLSVAARCLLVHFITVGFSSATVAAKILGFKVRHVWTLRAEIRTAYPALQDTVPEVHTAPQDRPPALQCSTAYKERAHACVSHQNERDSKSSDDEKTQSQDSAARRYAKPERRAHLEVSGGEPRCGPSGKPMANPDNGRIRHSDLGTELSPEREFRRRVAARHPGIDVEHCLRSVKRYLGPIELSEFLAYDEKRTMSPHLLRNPTGHYVVLAKAIARQDRDKLLIAALTPRKPMEVERCSCRGGRLAEGYCGCSMGKDLERVERRKP